MCNVIPAACGTLVCATVLATATARSAHAAASLTPLGDLPGGSFSAEPYAVSADGSVVVGIGNSASGAEAFRWTSGTGMQGLGDLPGGTFYSVAYGVSGDGSTVIGRGLIASGSEAFRWTSGTGMQGLGDLPGSGFNSTARGVSGDGSTIVGYGVSASGYEAFRWTSGTGMQRLWDVLIAAGVNPADDGWTTLGGAYGISADGNTIVGFGVRNGNAEGFIAVIPEPGAIGALACAAVLMLRRGRRN
jgi:probable HAF family extracellular repeat protein